MRRSAILVLLTLARRSHFAPSQHPPRSTMGKDLRIAHVEGDAIGIPDLVPNDPLYGSQPHLRDQQQEAAQGHRIGLVGVARHRVNTCSSFGPGAL